MQLETFRLQFINSVSLYGEITEMHDKKVSNFDFPIESGDSPMDNFFLQAITKNDSYSKMTHSLSHRESSD